MKRIILPRRNGVGRVLPVGGVKSKVLAAHRRGMKRIILPRRNGVDLEDVPAAALAELDVVLVDTMVEVLDAALEPVAAAGIRAA
jgi:ATP-dependent Lon protease